MLRPAVLAICLVLGGIAPARADWEVKRDPFDRALIARYKALLARHPHDAGVLAQLVGMYKRHRSVRVLADEYRAAPPAWGTLVVLGTLERRLGDAAKALAHYEAAVATNANDGATWRAIGELRAAGGKRIAAREAYQRALALARTEAQQARALRDLIAFVQGSGDREGEEAYFTQLVALRPRDVDAWVERGDAMLASGRWELAQESFAAAERLLGTYPQRRIEVITRGALVYEKRGMMTEALRELRRALVLGRGTYAAREVTMQLLGIHRRAKQLEAAIAELSALWPERTRTHFEWRVLGSLYDDLGEAALAIAAYERAVARAPGELVTQLRLIELLDITGNPSAALERLVRIARASPEDLSLQLALAQRYGRTDDRAHALLAALAKQHAHDPDVLTAIAKLYVGWNLDDRAEVELAKVVAATIRARDPAKLLAIGTEALALGLFGTAETAFATALTFDDTNLAAWRGLASAADGMHAWERAFDALEEVLARIPDDAAHRAERRAVRKTFIQVLQRSLMDSTEHVHAYLERWMSELFTPENLEAAYFLAAYFAVSPREDEPRRALERLHALVPDDPFVAQDLELVRQIERDMLDLERSRFIRDPFPDRVRDERSSDLLGPRLALRVGAGAGMRGDIPLTLSAGTGVGIRVLPWLSSILRLDGARRAGDLGSVTALAFSSGLAVHVFTNRQIAVLLGASGRGEVRFGDELARTGWGRFDIATDLSAEIVLRDAPFTVGMRAETWSTGRVVGLLEIGYEWR